MELSKLSLTRSQILVGQHQLHVAQSGLGRDDQLVAEGTQSIHVARGSLARPRWVGG